MTSQMIIASEWHYGRQWEGHLIEDECPCPQAPCGLVAGADTDPACPQHSLRASKTMRQGHLLENCMGES